MALEHREPSKHLVPLEHREPSKHLEPLEHLEALTLLEALEEACLVHLYARQRLGDSGVIVDFI